MRLALRFAAVVAPLLFLAACDDFSFGDFERYKEDFHYTYPLNPGGRVALENLNGSVEISSWEKDSVEINGTKYANSEQSLKELRIDVSSTPAVLQVRTVPAMRFRNSGARYTIRVPRRVQLDRIVSSNGSIRVEDVEGPANLHSSNGTIRIWRLKGPLDAQTTNGSIEATNQNGSANLHTSNGGIRVEIEKGSLQASTSNGSITARLMQPDAEQPVRLESSNGHIELSMDAVRDVHASTSNSSIVVHLPDAVNARVRARTSNSSIQTDFEVLTRGMIDKHSLEGTLGTGGPLIDLSTSNGSIKLLKL
jgi:DUF4097 and DUF4098 domain-containing protein YvlB